MDTANDNNESLELDTSSLADDGVGSADTDNDGVSDDMIASIGELRDYEGGDLDDDSGPDPDAEAVEETGETDDDAGDSTTGADASEDHKSALTLLLGKGIKAETLEAIDHNTLIALAKSHGWESGSTDAGDDAGEAEVVDKKGKDDKASESDAFDESSIVDAISEDLGKAFDTEETGVISQAIAKAVAMGRGSSGNNEALTKQIAQQGQALSMLCAHYENMVIDAEVPKLAEIYPGISEDGGRDRLVSRANELIKQGMKASSPQDLLRNAAVIEFGEAAVKQHKQIAKKVSRSKVSGQPTGKRGGVDTAPNSDDEGLSIVKNWKQQNT